MRYSEMFKDSAELYPTGGATLSPAACALLLAEMEALVRKYKKELTDESMSETLRQMTIHHLEGLEAIEEQIRVGMKNKPRDK